MGKWAEVHCACPNRRPVPGSDFMFGKPHRNKRRLTKKQSEDVAEWERTTKNMYECGHRSGVVVEFWPGDIVQVGYLIGNFFKDGFEIFRRVGDWRCYDDELLLIQCQESELWLMEIEELQQALMGQGNVPQDQMDRLIFEFFRTYVDAHSDLRWRLDEVAANIPFAGVNGLLENVKNSEEPSLESVIEKLKEAAAYAALLCRASIETRNPIRLLW